MTRYGWCCFFLVGLLSVVGCGSDTGSGGGNSLGGSAAQSYDLSFDRIEIFHQQDQGRTAYTVKYVREEETGAVLRWPAIVVVTDPERNVAADLTVAGNRLYRQDEGGNFVVASGTATFSRLGEPGSTASGTFAAVLAELAVGGVEALGGDVDVGF